MSQSKTEMPNRLINQKAIEMISTGISLVTLFFVFSIFGILIIVNQHQADPCCFWPNLGLVVENLEHNRLSTVRRKRGRRGCSSHQKIVNSVSCGDFQELDRQIFKSADYSDEGSGCEKLSHW